MHYTKPFGLFSLLILVWASCQTAHTSSKTDNPYQSNYYIRYMADDQILQAEATFIPLDSLSSSKEGVSLTEPPHFQGTSMKAKHSPIMGLRYQYRLKSPYQKDYTFSYPHTQHQIHTSAVLNPQLAKPLSLTKGGRLNWQGEPLAENERLVILISLPNGTVITLNRLGPSSQATTAILPEQIGTAQVGDAILTIVRKKQSTLSDLPHFQGNILFEYYSEAIPIEIIP